MDFDIFGRNVTDKVSNEKIYYVTSNTYASARRGIKTENAKTAFFLKCCISALPEFNQLLDFVNLFDSRLILALLYDSLSLVIYMFSYGLLGAWLRRKEVDGAAPVGLCCVRE